MSESQHTPANLAYVKEALRIVNTGKGEDGASYTNIGRLNQAAWIGEHSGALIEEIERLRDDKSALVSACRGALDFISAIRSATSGSGRIDENSIMLPGQRLKTTAKQLEARLTKALSKATTP